jgi:hypothetical protein
MGLRITMAGQNITDFVQEASIQIEVSLAQGSGTGNGTSGRATSCQFVTSLGPAASAVGAGTVVSSPTLVRQGEVQIYDSGNNLIYGGYASQLDDQTEYTRIYTQVTCEDYWQFCDRIIINSETFTAQTDIQIIKYLLDTYAPWVDQSLLPGTPAYTFPTFRVRSKSLQWALQKIVDTVGYQIYITPDKKVHYQTPLQAQTAPFALSTEPTFNTSQPFQVTDFTIDDTGAINRVYFFGGKRPSNDFTQDLSPQANGNNTTFVLAYYPREASDGKVHVVKNGVELVVGFAVASDNNPDNIFKSQGGNADVLLNSDAHTLQFDVAPLGTDTLTAKYRYETPLVVVLTNQQSVNFYGRFLDGVISDDQVFDTQTAVQRCKALLLQQAFGLKTLTCSTWTTGLWPGMLVRVDHSVRGIHDTFIVQDVQVVPLGGGQFRYDLTLGAWNWNLVDVLVQLAQAAAPANDNTEQDTTSIAAFIIDESLSLQETWTVSGPFAMGQYYARSTPLGDGHDAYPGFFSVSS